MLAMKDACERCGAVLAPHVEAYICTYECTFCPTCVQEMDAICPNCGGELVRRPRKRVVIALAEAATAPPSPTQ